MSENYGEYTADPELLYLDVNITVRCTHKSVPAFTNGPPELCYPSEAAEFEFEGCMMTIKNDDDHALVTTEMKWEELVEFFGETNALKLLDAAEDKANESGEFGGPSTRRHNQHWPR